MVWRNDGHPDDHEVVWGLASVRYPQDTDRWECSCGLAFQGHAERSQLDQHLRDVGKETLCRDCGEQVQPQSVHLVADVYHGLCPACYYSARHRRLRDVLKTYGIDPDEVELVQATEVRDGKPVTVLTNATEIVLKEADGQ